MGVTNKEKRLVAGCLRREQTSQMELYRLYYSYGLGICRRYAKSEQTAKEMLNDAFLKVYANDGSLFGTTNHEAGWSVMPTNGVKIPACEIEQLRLWIEKGALNN